MKRDYRRRIKIDKRQLRRELEMETVSFKGFQSELTYIIHN
jgi:hypothetical protein